jgi:hypothetical protein
VAATFLGIGLCYLVVTCYGFFNPAFRVMDRRQTGTLDNAPVLENTPVPKG